MRSDLKQRIEEVAADRSSGASEILDRAIAILREALASPPDVLPAARALCRAQPAMAPMWTAACAAIDARDDPGRFEAFAARVARAPRALARFAGELLATGAPADRPLRLVTISSSRSVLKVLEHAASRLRLEVACAESRPGLEGRTLAARLAGGGIPVTLFLDAAIAHALDEADAVLVGADAVTPDWFLNKSGTRMLAAAAAQAGVPVYVVASRDKFVGPAIAARLQSGEGDRTEVWEAPPPGVLLRNPYFERTPVELMSAAVTDQGVLGPGDLPHACANSESYALI